MNIFEVVSVNEVSDESLKRRIQLAADDLEAPAAQPTPTPAQAPAAQPTPAAEPAPANNTVPGAVPTSGVTEPWQVDSVKLYQSATSANEIVQGISNIARQYGGNRVEAASLQTKIMGFLEAFYLDGNANYPKYGVSTLATKLLDKKSQGN